MADFSALVGIMDGINRDKLGEPVTISPSAGSPVIVTGIFDRVAVHLDVSRAGMAVEGPSVALVLADLPVSPLEDLDMLVTVRGVTYRIREPMPDGMGMIRLLLHENT